MTAIALLTSLVALGTLAATRRRLQPASPAPQVAQTVPAWPFVVGTVAVIAATWALAHAFPWLAPALAAGTLVPFVA